MMLEQAQPREVNCPICRASYKYEFTTKYAVVRKCGNSACGHLYAVVDNKCSGIHEHAESNINQYASRNCDLVQYLISKNFLKPGYRILDVGSGLGHIMVEVKRQLPTVEVVCVERAPNSVGHLISCGFPVIKSLDEVTSASPHPFDSIFMVEVIEHLDDPIMALKICKAAISPGGSMLLTTPSGELGSGNRNTAAYETPEHVQFFTEKSLILATSLAGFSSIEFREVREFHAGNKHKWLKWTKDTLRILRNIMNGRHHLIAFIK